MATQVVRAGWQGLMREVLSLRLYKWGQGLTIRGLTFLGLTALVFWGAERWYGRLVAAPPVVRLLVPGVFLFVGLWLSFRLVNYPPLADFLIDTEWEMRKVTWPTWQQLRRATYIVITITLILTVFLYLVDLVWTTVLRAIGVLWVPPA
jgi:preprotein translocase subunit SecE